MSNSRTAGLTGSDDSTARETLIEAARERWGEAWVLETREWADGDKQHVVKHSRGVVDDGRRERDQLMLDDDGKIVVERVVVRPEEVESRDLVDRGE